VFISSLIPQSQVYKTVGMVFTSSKFYLSVILSVLAMFVIDLVIERSEKKRELIFFYKK